MIINDIETFLAYYGRVRYRTRKVAAIIPPDRIEWTYRAGKFTFGDLLRHLAALERYMFVENAVGRPSRYPGHGMDLAAGREQVLEYLDRLHAESLEILATLSAGDLLSRTRTPAGAEITVWKWLRAMIEHEIHHRGQLYLYLGILDIETPPLYGLTSEQVRDAT